MRISARHSHTLIKSVIQRGGRTQRIPGQSLCWLAFLMISSCADHAKVPSI